MAWLAIARQALPLVSLPLVIEREEIEMFFSFVVWRIVRRFVGHFQTNDVLLAVCACVVDAVVGSPVDVIKTRCMNARNDRYKGVMQTVVDLSKEAGLRGFYKG